MSLLVLLLVIFSKSLIGDALFSYLVHYLENERYYVNTDVIFLSAIKYV